MLILVVVVAASSVLSLLRGYLYGMAGERLVLRLRRQLFERIMAMEVGMPMDSNFILTDIFLSYFVLKEH